MFEERREVQEEAESLHIRAAIFLSLAYELKFPPATRAKDKGKSGASWPYYEQLSAFGDDKERG
jgi:hypothetical protein